MKKILSLLLFVVAYASATVTYFSNTTQRVPLAVDKESFSILLLDVTIGPGDTAFSRPVDLINIPVNYRDTGTGDATVLPDLSAGNGMLSCYDASDSAAVTDSVDVTGQLYVSQYAGDNNDPQKSGESGGKSDTWATLGSAYSIDDASASSAILEANAAITPTSQLDRFVRFRLINDNGNAKDVSRCRFYWVKKRVTR
jgi:hypothetical protein